MGLLQYLHAIRSLCLVQSVGLQFRGHTSMLVTMKEGQKKVSVHCLRALARIVTFSGGRVDVLESSNHVTHVPKEP